MNKTNKNNPFVGLYRKQFYTDILEYFMSLYIVYRDNILYCQIFQGKFYWTLGPGLEQKPS